MTNSLDDIFGHLDTPVLPVATKIDTRPTFPCQSCAGTGRYRGVRVHQQESKCFACGGKGTFKTSHADRMKARTASATRKAEKLAATQAAFREESPGVAEFLQANTWSDFLKDMLRAYETYGSLTDKQLDAVRRTQLKVTEREEARRAKKAEVKATRTTALDLSPIHAMFDAAQAAGLKKLAYRAEGLVLSLAKAGGANPGAIYVKTKGGEYLGKVVAKQFSATREATDAHREALAVIAADPSKAARDYGKETGECCCCGRELTDPRSIEMGIGPICADNWGL